MRVAMAERSVPKPSVSAPRMMSPIIVAIINSFSSLSCSLQTMWAKMQRKFLPMFAELPRLLIMLLIFYFIVINFTKKKERNKWPWNYSTLPGQLCAVKA